MCIRDRPYLYDISLCGSQLNFDRKEAGKRLGESGNEYEGIKICLLYTSVEIHAHGGGGRDFMECTEDAFRGAVQTHMKYGTTSIFPTPVSYTHLRF